MIDETQPHVTARVQCLVCSREWVAVAPITADLRELECPGCGEFCSEVLEDEDE